ncbi:hypothetical protein C8A05DRAFT_37637 [Staphylotrichum tortipilum]|uniref:Negative regulator of differentiation 1 n=1 Tax=Staphylotrichum tortipilum TaxID=2831512 RepID=A0AAN6RQI9_9PEZI|nr:hypothetical protein C8A05DRAFT_37637 [Staphylotrichum longicolle]
MASSSNGNGRAVTIDREYFDTLVRRAQLNSESPKTNGHHASVVISRDEYDRLMLSAKQYANLRQNLLRGGVGESTVDLLSQDDKTIQAGHQPTATATATPSVADTTEDGGVRVYPTAQRVPTGPYGQRKEANHCSPRARHHERTTWADQEVDEDEEDDNAASEAESPVETIPGANYVKPQNQRQQYERQCVRTVVLTGLADGTTHAELANAVRGGLLLDIFLRSHERAASISFLHSADAKKFYDHVRRHDLYIRNKRVEIKWGDRQFVLPGHVANKISMGATRNLVVHGYDNRHTEDVVRDDLDHIHNLVVVKVEFVGGNCYIGLNSVHNAIYARQCMLSRLRYKGKKISYDIDECDQPYPPPPAPKPRKETAAPKKGLAAVQNRFQLLNLDDGEEDEIATAFQSKKSVGITA